MSRYFNSICHPAIRPRIPALIIIVGALVMLSLTESWGEQELSPIIELEKQVAIEGAHSQKIVSELSAATQKYLEAYRATRHQISSLRSYNQEIQKLIEAQKAEMSSIEHQIGRASGMEREIVPLMTEMVDTLGKFVDLDLPFLPDERTLRLRMLNELKSRSDVATAEKYRRIIEAYQIESEYGRTIEAYRASIELEAGQRIVDVLRVGRIALLYRGLEGNIAGFWDQESNKWQSLPDEYDAALRRGIMIARKQAAPDLLELPVRAAMRQVSQ